jgi:hypothetical protein
MLFGDEGEADPSRLPPSVPATDATEVSRHRPEIASPPLFHPLAYRGVVAEWPIEFREQWGRRANALEESLRRGVEACSPPASCAIDGTRTRDRARRAKLTRVFAGDDGVSRNSQCQAW